jgi:hypothetical protein
MQGATGEEAAGFRIGRQASGDAVDASLPWVTSLRSYRTGSRRSDDARLTATLEMTKDPRNGPADLRHRPRLRRMGGLGAGVAGHPNIPKRTPFPCNQIQELPSFSMTGATSPSYSRLPGVTVGTFLARGVALLGELPASSRCSWQERHSDRPKSQRVWTIEVNGTPVAPARPDIRTNGADHVPSERWHSEITTGGRRLPHDT